jgi:hypothetical protein
MQSDWCTSGRHERDLEIADERMRDVDAHRHITDRPGRRHQQRSFDAGRIVVGNARARCVFQFDGGLIAKRRLDLSANQPSDVGRERNNRSLVRHATFLLCGQGSATA